MLRITALLATITLGTAPDVVETHWGGPARLAYETGFAECVRRRADGQVGLFDMELVANDAPGSGLSEKGVCSDVVWGPHRARKILRLDDPRAHRAFVVIFTYTENPPHPLTFHVNGHEGQITKVNRETYRWAEFPAAVLKAGENVVELSCPQAQSAAEGWELYLARADEFEAGGGDGKEAGKTSFQSADGGATWAESPFGPDRNVRAEYSVRLSLDRHLPRGVLETPVIDLWRGDSTALVVPLRRLIKVDFRVEADTPEGTRINYYLRRGTDPSPHGASWESYEELPATSGLNVSRDGAAVNRRYVQLKAVLTTENPLRTPVVRSIEVQAQLQNTVKPLTNLYVLKGDNPVILYPSVDWQWESWARPEFEELRRRENLDEVIAGSRTSFQAQLKLLDHTVKRWSDGRPTPEYPHWDALSIADRIDKAGAGGMCIQSNNFLAGMCMAFGWAARHVNITAHEVCEVWNDEYGKWIYLDGHQANHYVYDNKTGEPLNILELHERHLEKFYPGGRIIDWMNDPFLQQDDDGKYSVSKGMAGPGRAGHNGLTLAAFVRMIPRTNWFAAPFPRPLTHGCLWWPWDGYINWYDAQTPPKRQYSRYTDRHQDMWPALNEVRVHATSGVGNDRLPLRFETYTPNFDRFEVNADDAGWKEVGARWVWLLGPGRNTLRVRAVNKQNVSGKPTEIVLNRAVPD